MNWMLDWVLVVATIKCNIGEIIQQLYFSQSFLIGKKEEIESDAL